MFFEEFLCVFFGDFTDAFIFVDTDYGRLFAHPLAFHFFNINEIFEPGFLHEILETFLDFAVVFTAFFSIAQQDHFLFLVFLSHRFKLVTILKQIHCKTNSFYSYLF